MDDSTEITKLLNAAERGSQDAVCHAWAVVQQEVRGMAALLVARESKTPNLQPTLVMNEVFLRLKLGTGESRKWDSREHFFGCVWRVMRQFLIDYARAQQTKKRGGGRRPITLNIAVDELANLQHAADEIDLLLWSLDRLCEQFPRQHEVLWRRFALDQTVEDVATAMAISPRTVAEDWRYARTWLRRDMLRREESQ